MGAQRGNETDRPAEIREQTDVDRTKELYALGDARAFDPRTPTYNPLDHVTPRRERPEPPQGLGDRPTLLGLSAKVREAREERYESSDAEQLVDAVEGRAEPDEAPERTRAWRTIAEEEGGDVRSFSNYRAARGALGSVPGDQIHHLVEQRQEDASGFSRERINSTDNLTRIPEPIHKEISRFFSSKPPGWDQVVRYTMDGEPWDEQHKFGGRMLDRVFEEADDDDDDD